ncbi:hypothetical protein I7I53_08942 [Histoplasma capsulatum var. duboisii H88]|uniref:Reverse transcriptase Ty1/copia-type domain-containing protein n=1 Tax=Ajellomyces capsulatus (strain H88) TaxID=544711 RepID=A0A8A1L4F1_AJEC8|nr:hypothetical protein I7I53_08942 [Histoplasma capsulatum var. duboisii H88]
MGNLEWFLNMRITRDRSSKKLWLCQDAYIDKLVDTYHFAHARKASTPLSSIPLAPYQGTASPEDTHYYQRRIGSCIYAAVMTRPDIAYAIGKLAIYMTNPSERHSAEIDRVIAYLRDSKNLAIEYSVSDGDGLSMNVFEAASDASFVDNSDRRSTEGYIFKLFEGSVDWKSKRQRIVTTSTTEAELLAISQAGKESI